MSNIKHKLDAKPLLEDLNKGFEDDAYTKWSKFLHKQNKQKKYLEKSEKDVKMIKGIKKDKDNEHDVKIKVNIKHEKELYKEKCQKMN